MDTSSDQLKDFLRDLCLSSGRVIMDHYRRRDLQVEEKSDHTPVTIADRNAEEHLRDRISQEFPDHGILGEEFAHTNPDAEYQWILDPIDGTISFLHGCPLFGTLIGLTRAGDPWLGAIHHPALELLLIGDRQTTTSNGEPANIRRCAGLDQAVLLASDALYMKRPDFSVLADQCRIVRTWGDCYGYAQVAAGFADVMVDPILSPWDLLPLVPVIEGAGGKITEWDGQPISMESASAIAAHPDLHPQVINALQSV